MDDWVKFNETSLPKKVDFYSQVNMEDIADANYGQAKRNLYRFCTNFRNMCIDIYELDTAKFLSAPGLAWQATLKKTQVKLDLLTDFDMLLMVERDIRGGICNLIH